jgi:hypothetical protein
MNGMAIATLRPPAGCCSATKFACRWRHNPQARHTHSHHFLQRSRLLMVMNGVRIQILSLVINVVLIFRQIQEEVSYFFGPFPSKPLPTEHLLRPCCQAIHAAEQAFQFKRNSHSTKGNVTVASRLCH